MAENERLVSNNRRAMKQWLAECGSFFDETAELASLRNWDMLHTMSLIYLAFIGAYLLLICPVMDIELQVTVVSSFVLVHAAFTLWVFLKKKVPSVKTVDLAISLFAVQILGLSGFLEIGVFRDEASFLFPLCLILMTQIYTRRPIFPITEVLLPAVIYLIICWNIKDTYSFLLDFVSVSIAVAISGAALYSMINYKMKTYQAQLALQKMCTLDPMTKVNNKPTFEFLVNEFLHGCTEGGHALVLCDFDDFKSINDRFGHHVGDKVLEAFVAQLHELSDGDENVITGRFGGDEFVLFFKSCESKQAVIDEMTSIANVSGFDFPVSCSIGVGFSESGDADFRKLFDAADKSLYMAKDIKSGMVCAWDADEWLQ